MYDTQNCTASNDSSQRPPQILARSEDCQLSLTHAWSQNSKTIGLFTFFTAFIAMGLFIYLNGKVPFLITIVILAIAAVICFWLNSIMTKGRADYARYLEYCNKECMAIDEEKVYGRTATGDFLLTFEQIKGVRTISNMRPGEVRALEKVILQITDNTGKLYTFYSFKNTSELYSVIRTHMLKKQS